MLLNFELVVLKFLIVLQCRKSVRSAFLHQYAYVVFVTFITVDFVSVFVFENDQDQRLNLDF